MARWFLSKYPKKTGTSVQITDPFADAVISANQPYQVTNLPLEVEVEDLPFDVEPIDQEVVTLVFQVLEH